MSDKQNQKKRKPASLCVYCQKDEGNTVDEVIARSFFHGNPPKEGYLKVPACQNCNNNLKAPDDEYLREMLTLDISTYGSTTARGIVNNKIIPGVKQRNEKGLKPTPIVRDAWYNTEMIPAFDENGKFLGFLPKVPLDLDRVKRAFFRIVKGLYYARTGNYFPYLYEDVVVDVVRVFPDNLDGILQAFVGGGFEGPFKIGDEFHCVYAYSKTNPETTGWLMTFYGNVTFFVRTTAKP